MDCPATLCIWSALCIGLAFCNQDQGSLGSSWTCTAKESCANPKFVVKDGGHEVRTCVTSEGQDGVCCITGAKAGNKSAENCKEYAKSVFTKVYMPYTQTWRDFDTCRSSGPLIINGKKSDPREFPHMALIGSLQYDEVEWHCGGSLVSELYVLSAAHCSQGVDVFDEAWVAKWVRLGEYNVTSKVDERDGLAQSKDYDIVEWLNHPGYTGEYGAHDIALYKLNSSVEFNEFVRPICLNSQPHITQSSAIVTGWGVVNWETEKRSDVLLKANLTIAACVKVDNKPIDESRKPSLICAADLENERDQCMGDSGGPLQIRLADPYCMYSVLGVASYGPRPCAKVNHSCYTRVSYYLPWIESIVWPSDISS